ncbi:MAG: carboxypeptidase regulatory-like domain-containing protein [Bernardetiaceae bacterium]
MIRSLFFLLFCLLLSVKLLAQSQSIRGLVKDAQSEIPLPGATIVILESDPLQGTVSDENGRFLLTDVAVGRRTIRVQFIGYETITLPNVLIIAGKETLLSVVMRESFEELDEIVITPEVDKDKPNNDLATISARSFNMEEVTRFSGGRNDVARLASNFAGVSTANDSRNDIVIRGNSPTGVLWRIEGIPIPNPNHFSTLGTTGGPVSALNTNLIRYSDFLTGAFPAEYGNANAGVFDVGFRSGNTDKTEFTFQMAFTGIEGMAEGPLNTKNNGSFLVSYRYSFVGLVNDILPIGTNAAPNYQDISFKVDLGQSKIGKIELFGIGGASNIAFLADEIDQDDLFAEANQDFYARSRIGLLGIKHTISVGKDAFLRTILAFSHLQSKFWQDEYELAPTKINTLDGKDTENRYSVHTYLNKKLNRRLTLRAGMQAEIFDIGSLVRDRSNRPDLTGDGLPDWITVRDFEGRLPLYQVYLQSQYRLTQDVTLNIGLHGQYLSFNDSRAIEPRLALNWFATRSSTFNFGYGLHSQMIPLPLLLYQDPVTNRQTNKNVSFTRSRHWIIGYDLKLGMDWRLKTEIYYQQLFDVPVQSIPSPFSLLNEGADFGFREVGSLTNEGSGSNYGAELTLEKFFSKNYYLLLTTSLYQSRYKGSDGIERNTAFNQNYVFNVLTGREFLIGKKYTLTIDTKLTTAGGRYYTPIDLEATRANFGRERLDDSRAFAERFDPYFRWDLKFGLRINSPNKRISQQFFVDFQNLTNHQNAFVRRYNASTDQINTVYQIGFFPDILYRLQF